MDTESFLLKREQIQAGLDAGRLSIADRVAYRGPTFLRIPVVSWIRLFIGPHPENWMIRWLQKLAWVSVIPAVLSLFKKWQVLPAWGDGVSSLLSRMDFWPFPFSRK